ncbi:hypothetical protein [Clostridium butyricum]|uniref:hypothetical protein n=1 Tax=Clostridium butyricum TaxID=1492 RepID=UPI002ABD9A26|nr:hypothetical protein [Clostridium butyricum]
MEKQNLREVIQIVETDKNGNDTFILVYKDTYEMVTEFSNVDILEDIKDIY